MSFTPCWLCHQMYRGKASTFYFAYLQHADREELKMLLCPQCCSVQFDRIAEFVTEIEYGVPQAIDLVDTCGGCGKIARDGGVALFVTAYPRGAERADFYGRCHIGRCTSDFWNLIKQPPPESTETVLAAS